MKRLAILGAFALALLSAIQAQPSSPSDDRIYKIQFRTFPKKSAIFAWKADDKTGQNRYGQRAGFSDTPLQLTVTDKLENYQVFFYYGADFESKERFTEQEMGTLPSATLFHDQLSQSQYPRSGLPIFLIQTPSQAWFFAMQNHLWAPPLLALGMAVWLWRRGLRLRMEAREESESSLVTRVGRYELGRTLGKGAAGEVFEVRNDQGEACALKLLHANLREDPESNKRFLREVQICSSLHHPNIVKILDWGQQGEVLYVVMELLEGESLAARLRQKPRMEPVNFVDLFYSIAQAVQCLHERGLVHRDLKPDNIFIRHDGRPVLMDFGIAFSEELTRATRTGLAMGTPAYMAPEQIQGQAEPASDQYSLGVVGFLCLTGQRPFTAEEPMALAMQHLHTPPPLPSSINSGLPIPFNHVLLKMLAKKPAERFATIMDAANALRGALNLSEAEEEATGLVGP